MRDFNYVNFNFTCKWVITIYILTNSLHKLLFIHMLLSICILLLFANLIYHICISLFLFIFVDEVAYYMCMDHLYFLVNCAF